MRGLDTNILMRFLTADDAAQTTLVAALLEDGERSGERFFISTIVLCELIWTLRGRPYDFGHDQLADVLDRILSARLFEIQNHTVVRRALGDFRQGRADFADYLLGRYGIEEGCTATVTFDRALEGVAGFQLLA